MLHPAKTLPTGDVRAALGFSSNVATGELGQGLRVARDEAAQNPNAPGPPGTDPTYARGALVAAIVAPGLAPFVGARVGIGDRFEGGIAYTGRDARIDMRRGFDLDNHVTLSIGAGGMAALYGHSDGTVLPNVNTGELHGYGADVPVLIGWESVEGLYMLWGGVRGGWEHDAISLLTSEPKNGTLAPPPLSLSGERYYCGGVVGLAVGFRHVHVALELDAAYVWLSGTFNGTDASLSGVTLAPASALWIDF